MNFNRDDSTKNQKDAESRNPSGKQSNSLKIPSQPSLEPYIVKLERFELFSTNQCYYLVGCNKLNTVYRVIKMDRTLIERPSDDQATQHLPDSDNEADNSHKPKPTLRPLADFLTEDPNVYSQEEIKDMLDMIHDGNRMTRSDGKSETAGGGLKPIVKAYGIVGFIRFLDCYYLTLITRRAKVGNIGGNGIYTIKNTETIPLKPAERRPGSDESADPSSVLLSMWNRGKRSVGLGLTNREIAELRYQGLYQVVDLTKNFYFSYTYDLTHSLQENFIATTIKPIPPPPFKDMYAWNFFLTREFEACLDLTTNFHWIMPIIHGAYVQRKVNDYGRILNIILLARRSRHFAGTRYLKRGVSEQGKVANDVEHEQILHDESMSFPGVFSSFLQVRGSIPTFWTQESSVTMPKPPIELNRVDPTYTATQLHFADLFRRYSSPILVLDLVKQSEKREREVRVGNEYRHAIDYINQTIDDAHKICYCALDYSHISKHRNLDVSNSLNDVSTWAVNQTGFFCSAPKWKITPNGSVAPFSEKDAAGALRLAEELGVPVFPMEQNGVLRTNCIDCLDRTNVAQFSAGVEAIGQQLVVMGIRSKAKLGPLSSIVRVLIDMYVDLGDSIALQYGGSEAHKKVTAGHSESSFTGPIGKHKELLTSIRRYYSNAFTDRLKQDAMNLFLGYYLPHRHSVPLWEMESDYYLHNFHVKVGRGTTPSMKIYQRFFGIEWSDDEDEELCDFVPTSATIQAQESTNVLRVRSRCNAQNAALSTWWKIALQANVKQRMNMRLENVYTEQSLRSYFDRVYQPEKIGQFDRFFSRAWLTPVRRSHAAQHSEGMEDEDCSELLRVIATDISPSKSPDLPSNLSVNPKEITLTDYIDNSEFQQPTGYSLQSFSEYFGKTSAPQRFDYIGQSPTYTVPPQDYVQYCTPSSRVFSQPQVYNEEKLKEFKGNLHDNNLNADNVAGIRELARSAHLDRIIAYGEYGGLFKDESAIEVATAIHEQSSSETSMSTTDHQLLENELARRGYNSTGVREAVRKQMDEMKKSQRQYSEIIHAQMSRCERSDLSANNSLKLYASMFNADSSLTVPDQIFLQTYMREESQEKMEPPLLVQSRNTTSFVEKASRFGIKITPARNFVSDEVQLCQPQYIREIPSGFEQINEDMFCRRDNKFMVFNGAGVRSWTGTHPITKISHAEKILWSTFS